MLLAAGDTVNREDTRLELSDGRQTLLRRRRERVLLLLSGIFLGTLAMLNILGISRFIRFPLELGSWEISVSLAVGVLPYPVTFFCTDLISELYGKARARFLVWIGLLLNLWVVFILWLGGVLPGFEALDPSTGSLLKDEAGRLPVFFEIRTLTFGAVTASMIAYLAAQFCDVHVFHWLKSLTRGRHLWLRNNGSTLISQLVDTVAVILITHFQARALPLDPSRDLWQQLLGFILAGYVFKMAVALFDTVPCYLAIRGLSRYLEIDPRAETPAQS